jgi:hypothetical protein
MLRHAVPAYPDEGQADLGRRKYLPCIPPNGKHSLGIDRLPLVRGYRSRLSLCRPRGSSFTITQRKTNGMMVRAFAASSPSRVTKPRSLPRSRIHCDHKCGAFAELPKEDRSTGADNDCAPGPKLICRQESSTEAS